MIPGVSPRRDFLRKAAMAAMAASASRIGLAQRSPKQLDEYDPANTKIAHRVSSRITDDDLLFLKQIGMRWARVEFGNEAHFDTIRATQERFARQGIGIFSGVHYAYRSKRVQLGQPGRDKDVETY